MHLCIMCKLGASTALNGCVHVSLHPCIQLGIVAMQRLEDRIGYHSLLELFR